MENNIIFTRYLYSKEEVGQSLLMSLLDHNYKEALYWGYELYFSGFRKESIDFVMMIYDEMYVNVNTVEFTKFIREKAKDIDNNQTIGVIIRNMALREYQIDTFLEKHFAVKCDKFIYEPKPVKILIQKIDVEPYMTLVSSPPEKARNLLKRAYKYKIRKNVGNLFLSSSADELNTAYLGDWLYYAFPSSIWEERIRQYGGIIDEDLKRVVFPDEDQEERFYDLHGYEPDEQPKTIQEFSLGSLEDNITVLSLRDFANQYGGNMVIRRRNILRK
jgi:hypothetical protein